MNRILIIRGGAIGDFILTLPAIKLLRDRFPEAHIEILGSPQCAALAEKRFYADAIRSLESGRLAGFFAQDSGLPSDLADYFAGFDLIVSYLFDPDKIFEGNVRKASAANFLTGPSRLDNSEHAALQLARPLAALGLSLCDPAAQLFPTDADREAVRHLRRAHGKNVVALHPGSGSETKNWPVENWGRLGDDLLSRNRQLLILAGEADGDRIDLLKARWSERPAQFVENLPLPQVAALLEGMLFVGHDSGISHIAAATGARCVLLFGWTDPAIWAPANENVTVLRAPEGKMDRLAVEAVISQTAKAAAPLYELMRIGIRT